MAGARSRESASQTATASFGSGSAAAPRARFRSMVRNAKSPAGGRSLLRRSLRRGSITVVLVMIALAALFAWNGLVLAQGTTPIAGTETPAVAGSTPRDGSRVRVLAWNLAKCFVHRGGLSFASVVGIEERLRRMAAVIREEDPDFVFLSEIVTECTLCDVDQLRFLARETGLAHWVFGENFNFGLPFLRIVGGNAILGRDALEPVANPDLVGRQPFWITRNNRRVLFARARIAGEAILLGSLHTDSIDLDNNLLQMRQILAFEPASPTLLAGDFNAEPDSASLAELIASRRFTGALDGPPTFPAGAARGVTRDAAADLDRLRSALDFADRGRRRGQKLHVDVGLGPWCWVRDRLMPPCSRSASGFARSTDLADGAVAGRAHARTGCRGGCRPASRRRRASHDVFATVRGCARRCSARAAA